ncbi:MAG: DedA family protein [bacterium]|nr:DedA family protein [bacterium]
MSWFDDPVAAALALPPLVLPLFVFASALIEYVFPPYWGDTFMLVGFFLAGQGAMSPPVAFAAAFSGSVVGSIVAYQLGRRYGLALVRRVSARRQQVSRGRLRDLFRRFGKKLLMVNRFLPVVRGFLLYGAGALKLPFRPVILYCTVSNLLFVGLLMSLGLWTAGSWTEIQESFQHSNRLIGGAVLAAVAAWAAVTLWRLRRAPQS